MAEPSLPEESIFGQALEITSAADRASFLDQACGNDLRLRAEVEALLRAHERSGDLLDLAESAQPTSELSPETPGTVIGPYKLLEQIGEGGMGTVWMAEQTDPIQRRVAVKVVKEGMDSKQVLARFEAERQALALMEHPNIARVLDAGRTPSGRPYFVMELVKGQPITKYCDEKRLGIRERLELFGDVCRAVQHAHQKGIIHRDVKPSNVLVAPYDGKPVIKVIDFGVAKATGQRLTDKTLFTGFGALVGTPEYMSPEQAEVNNQDIDTRSDIYSLGVLLYELLTGSTPLTRKRIQEAALLEVLRVIREEEPPRPSTRLSESKDSLPSISAQRQTEPAKLTKLVRGELDWIAMKALEKDRGRRYETANGLVMDIQRYLADEPVQACPPSAWYRFRKFARRHRGGLSTAAILAGALVVTAIALAVSNVLVTQERDEKALALHDKEEALKQESFARAKAKEQEALANRNAKVSQQQELLARRRLYNAQINLAHQAWEAGNPQRVLELLEGQRPRFDEEDMRTFEWYYLWRLCRAAHRFTLRGHDSKNHGNDIWQSTEIFGIDISPDGKTLASANRDTVKLWDIATGKERTALRGPHGFRAALAFSPGGKLLVTGGFLGQCDVWDLTSGKALPIHLPQHSMEGAAVFSPDGKTLAGGNYNGTIKLWDVASWRESLTIQAHAESVGVLRFSPDGRILASAAAWASGEEEVNLIKLWDLTLKTPRLLWQLNGEYTLAFSPDGKTLAAGGNRVHLYDLATGRS
jgi:serine/threonine protein kinase